MSPRQDSTSIVSDANSWVFSSELGPLSRGNHKYYTSSRSPTYTALDYTWAISYAGKSEASGIVGTDTVVIGGTTVTKQAVELASHVSSDFVLSEADGSVGLAFDSINTVSPVRQKTFFSNAESSLHSPLFAAYLPSNADGAYDFGYTDTSHYTGTISMYTICPYPSSAPISLPLISSTTLILELVWDHLPS